MLLPIFINDIFPILAVAGVGFVLARVQRVDVRMISRVTFYALSPCLVFSILVGATVPPDELVRMTLFTVASMSALFVLARIVAIPFRLSRAETAAFLVVVTFSNNGNFGLSAAMFAFGRDALARASVYFVVSAALIYTAGVFIASAGRRSAGEAALGILRVPAVYGVLFALPILAFGLRVPVAIMRPVSLLSDAAIPVMLLVLGMQLERAVRPARPGLVLASVALSLVVSPVVAFGLADVFALTGPARQGAILQASMPAAVVTTILALEYEVDASFVTGVVTLSTLLSPLTVTIVIALLSRGAS